LAVETSKEVPDYSYSFFEMVHYSSSGVKY
jgi:hypothetical protein